MYIIQVGLSEEQTKPVARINCNNGLLLKPEYYFLTFTRKGSLQDCLEKNGKALKTKLNRITCGPNLPYFSNPYSRSTLQIRTLKPAYQVSRPLFRAMVCSACSRQFLIASRSCQYETVIPIASRALSTPKKPGCCAASATIFSAITA